MKWLLVGFVCFFVFFFKRKNTHRRRNKFQDFSILLFKTRSIHHLYTDKCTEGRGHWAFLSFLFSSHIILSFLWSCAFHSLFFSPQQYCPLFLFSFFTIFHQTCPMTARSERVTRSPVDTELPFSSIPSGAHMRKERKAKKHGGSKGGYVSMPMPPV